MADSLVLLPGSSLQSARASKKITSEILFGKLRTSFDSFISKNEGMAKISTTMVFGTPVDVTLSELALETFFPADGLTAARLRQMAAQLDKA